MVPAGSTAFDSGNISVVRNDMSNDEGCGGSARLKPDLVAMAGTQEMVLFVELSFCKSPLHHCTLVRWVCGRAQASDAAVTRGGWRKDGWHKLFEA